MRRSILILALLLTLFVCDMHAQSYTGTYTIQSDAGPVVLTLQQNERGQVQGRLAGEGVTYEVQGMLQGNGLSGTVAEVGTGLSLPFVAQRQGGLLYIQLYEVDAAGQPNYASAQTLVFQPGEAAPPQGPVPQADAASGSRDVAINGQHLSTEKVRALEQLYQTQVPDGRYWYDARCGAWGLEGGPTLGFMMAGLDLPGPMPVDISGGGTGIFINGREIHPQDQMALYQLLGVTYPGRYQLDVQGNLGVEGGAFLVNLVQASQQAGGSKGGITSGIGGTVGVDGSGGVLIFNRNASGGYNSWSN